MRRYLTAALSAVLMVSGLATPAHTFQLGTETIPQVQSDLTDWRRATVESGDIVSGYCLELQQFRQRYVSVADCTIDVLLENDIPTLEAFRNLRVGEMILLPAIDSPSNLPEGELIDYETVVGEEIVDLRNLADQLVVLERQNASLESDMKAFESQLEALQLDEIAASINALKTSTEENKSAIERVDGTLSGVNSRLDALEQQLQELAARPEGITAEEFNRLVETALNDRGDGGDSTINIDAFVNGMKEELGLGELEGLNTRVQELESQETPLSNPVVLGVGGIVSLLAFIVAIAAYRNSKKARDAAASGRADAKTANEKADAANETANTAKETAEQAGAIVREVTDDLSERLGAIERIAGVPTFDTSLIEQGKLSRLKVGATVLLPVEWPLHQGHEVFVEIAKLNSGMFELRGVQRSVASNEWVVSSAKGIASAVRNAGLSARIVGVTPEIRAVA